MRKIILMIVAIFSITSTLKAQEKTFPQNQVITPYKIEVTYSKTVHILFPCAVKYVDLGSSDIIAGKADGAENVVRIKATIKDFKEETNFSVITSDGCFYSFNATYNDNSKQLSIEMEDWLRKNPFGEFANDRMFVKLVELGDETPVIVNKIMHTIHRKNAKDIKDIKSKKFGIETALRSIYIHNDLLYLHTMIKNSSNVSYDIDYIRFKVVDKKVAKRTAIQETQLYPVRTYNETTRVEGRSTERNIFVLPKITIPDNKILVVEIYEKNGGRHQTFKIQNKDLVDAKLVNELKLK